MDASQNRRVQDTIDAVRRDAISPWRNLLKSYGFKFKRAVTYFTRYDMTSCGDYAWISTYLVISSGQRRRFLRPNLEEGTHWQYLSDRRNRRTVLMKGYRGAEGPRARAVAATFAFELF